MKEDQIRNLKILLQRLDNDNECLNIRLFRVLHHGMATLTQTTFQQTYMEIASIEIR